MDRRAGDSHALRYGRPRAEVEAELLRVVDGAEGD